MPPTKGPAKKKDLDSHEIATCWSRCHYPILGRSVDGWTSREIKMFNCTQLRTRVACEGQRTRQKDDRGNKFIGTQTRADCRRLRIKCTASSASWATKIYHKCTQVLESPFIFWGFAALLWVLFCVLVGKCWWSVEFLEARQIQRDWAKILWEKTQGVVKGVPATCSCFPS